MLLYPCPADPVQPLEDSAQLFAKSGVAYYMSPPHTLKEVVTDPIHTSIYIVFMLTACALFSKTWIEVSGSGPRDVAKQLKDQGMVMAGSKDGSMYKELKRVRPNLFCWGGADKSGDPPCCDTGRSSNWSAVRHDGSRGRPGVWNGYPPCGYDHLLVRASPPLVRGLIVGRYFEIMVKEGGAAASDDAVMGELIG